MSTRKSTFFYAVLLSLASVTAGMVLASRFDLTSGSFAGTVNVPATNSAPLTGAIDATTFRMIAHDQSPTVVSIVVSSTARASRLPQNLPPGFEEFLGRGGAPSQPQETHGAGSGFIIDKAGFILTNNHVVENADAIEVFLFGDDNHRNALSAKIVGRDPLTDSALLQLTEMPKAALQEAKFGDSDQMQPGDWVMAIGNPFELSHSVSVGVISAVGRVDQNALSVFGRDVNLLQTDAAINRGNSGGPLLNVRGEVIGINNQILTNESEGNIGIGFALPINMIRDILPRLRTGKVIRGRIGVFVSRLPFTDDQLSDLGLTNGEGALVSKIEANGPGEAAGLHLGDVIVEFNGKPIKDSAQLVEMVMGTAPNTTVPVKILRAKKTQTLNIRIAEFDAEQVAQATTAPAAGSGRRGQRALPAEPVTKDAGLGLTVQDLTPEVARQLPAGAKGVIVTKVQPRSAAAQKGISAGDIILKINDVVVTGMDDVIKKLDAVPVGRTVYLTIWSGGAGGGESLVLVQKR